MKTNASICPYCGEDRNKIINITELRQLCMSKGLTGEQCNPGGRKLVFGTKSLQISDMCNACDEKAIRNFLDNELSQT